MTPAPLQHLSTFSGVGGIDIAFERAGVETLAVAEFDKHARGVLADRFPAAHIFNDVKDVNADELHKLGFEPGRTVLSGGFPCQDLSVAGARRGLGEGTRSGLYWELDRIMAEFRPRWVVFENVPGLLSACCACPGDGTCTDRGITVRCPGDGAAHVAAGERCTKKCIKGHDQAHAVTGGSCWGDCIARHGGVMGAVLGSLAERGYGFAYRVLDAQHFGVPQRRRRVVIVGRFGDSGAAPGTVLLEPEGVPGDPFAGLTAGPRVAGTTRGGVAEGGAIGSLTAQDGRLDDNQASQLVVGTPDVAATLTAGTSSPGVSAPGRRQEDDVNLVAFHHQQEPINGQMSPTIEARSRGMGIAYMADVTGTLDTRDGGADVKEAQDGRLVATYQKITRPASSDHPDVWAERDVAATLSPFDLGSDTRAVELVVEPVAIAMRGREEGAVPEIHGDGSTVGALRSASGGSSRDAVLAPTLTASLGEGGWAGHNRKDEMVERTFEAGATVRRLTPTECERLQGFPDGHTATSAGKPQADAQRYRQMGNAVCVNVFEWVGHRLVVVDATLRPTT